MLLNITKTSNLIGVLNYLCVFIMSLRHLEWICNLNLPECQGLPCSKKAQYLKIKWLQQDSNTQPLLLNGTHPVAVRGLIHQDVPTSASTSGACRSNAATSDKDKQICLSTLPRTGFAAEVCSYLAFHS